MLHLLLTVLFSTGILVAFKLFPRFNIGIVQAITVNYIVAVIFGIMQTDGTIGITDYIGKSWLPIAVVLGITFIATFYLFAESSQRAGVALTSVAAKMSVVIPVMLGLVLFHDPLSPLKLAGIGLALIAFYLTFKKEGKLTLKWAVILFPLLLFLGNGANDSLMKLVQHYHIQGDFEEFLTVVFLVALLSGLLVSLVRPGKGRRSFSGRDIIAGIILGLLNWYSTYFFMAGMQFFDVSVYVPLVSVSIVTLSSIIGYFIFREALSRVNQAGIVLALVAIVLIAVG